MNLFQEPRIASTAPKQIRTAYSAKPNNRKHRPQTDLKYILFEHQESQAPSPNKLEVSLLRKRRIASTVHEQIGKAYSSKTKNRKHRPQPNLERIFFKNKRIASNARKQIWKEYSSKTQNRRHRPLGKEMEGALLKNKESQAPSPKKLQVNLLQKQGIASTVPKQIRTESSAKTKNRKAPSPKKLEVNLFLKQRIAISVPKQNRKKYSSKTKSRKPRPQTNLK